MPYVPPRKRQTSDSGRRRATHRRAKSGRVDEQGVGIIQPSIFMMRQFVKAKEGETMTA